jgi:hypothetical protein
MRPVLNCGLLFLLHIKVGVRPVQKTVLLAAIQKEIHRHDFSYFVYEPPPVAQDGMGVVVAGCPACKKRINTMGQFLDHLTNDVMPALIERLAAGKG